MNSSPYSIIIAVCIMVIVNIIKLLFHFISATVYIADPIYIHVFIDARAEMPIHAHHEALFPG